MFKRILLSLALAASLGGAVLACNSPSGTTSPSSGGGGVTTPEASAPAASDMVLPSEEPSAS